MMAYEAVTQTAVSIRFACTAFQISETCYRYQQQSEDDNTLIVDSLLILMMHILIGDLVCFLPTYATLKASNSIINGYIAFTVNWL